MRGLAGGPAAMGAGPLLLALLVSALSGAARAEFPLMADVILDVCGTGQFTLDASSPCHFHILGFSMAWSECSAFHKTDMKGFEGCLRSCVGDGDQCNKICGGGPKETHSQHCYGECDVVVQCVKDAAGSSTGPVSAEHEVSKCFYRMPATPAPASFLSLGAARRRELRRAQDQPLVSFAKLFPKSCEVHTMARARLEVPDEPDGHGTAPFALPEGKPIEPLFPEMKDLINDHLASATTLSPAWHAQHMSVFTGPEAKPDPGPALPEAVQTPNLESYFAPDEGAPSAAEVNNKELKAAVEQEKSDKATEAATESWFR